MATRQKSTAARDEPDDAIAMLTADHKKVKALFKQFANAKEGTGDDEKTAIVRDICNELTIHSTIEEEIFYPAVRKAIDDSDLMDEALVEHAGAKELVAQLKDVSPDDELYDAKVTVLGEQVNHHVKEEEGEMFPKARRAKVDTAALGAKMLRRKLAIMQELGVEDGTDEADETDEQRDGRTSKRAGNAAKTA